MLRKLIDAHPVDEKEWRRGRPKDSYGALLRSIIGQQLSTKAAATIYGRVIEPWGRAPTPEELLAVNPETLLAAGLSRAKATYVRDLAAHVLDGSLPVETLHELPDEGVSERLVAVKGIGQWTADMFLMFHLRRPDVLPVGDLGIRRAVERAYGLPALPDPAELTEIAEPWRPNRTLACLYLWESLDAKPG